MSGHRHFTPDVSATGFDGKPAADFLSVVGQIESVTGSCSLIRPGGDPYQVKRGDPVCRGDILETTAGGKVGIRFIDGTAFNLSDSARAVVKENPERVELVAFDLAMPPDVDTPEDYAKLHVQ